MNPRNSSNAFREVLGCRWHAWRHLVAPQVGGSVEADHGSVTAPPPLPTLWLGAGVTGVRALCALRGSATPVRERDRPPDETSHEPLTEVCQVVSRGQFCVLYLRSQIVHANVAHVYLDSILYDLRPTGHVSDNYTR